MPPPSKKPEDNFDFLGRNGMGLIMAQWLGRLWSDVDRFVGQPMPAGSREQIEQLYQLGFATGAINHLLKEAGHSVFRDKTAKAELDRKALELKLRLEERVTALTRGISDHLKTDSPVSELRRKFEGIENSWNFKVQHEWVVEAYKGGLRFLGDAAAATAESIGANRSTKPSENFDAIEDYQRERPEIFHCGRTQSDGRYRNRC